jgi:hypothetical protein
VSASRSLRAVSDPRGVLHRAELRLRAQGDDVPSRSSRSFGLLLSPIYLRFQLEGVVILVLASSITSSIATGVMAVRAAGIPVLPLPLPRPPSSRGVMSLGVLAFDAAADLPVLIMFLAKAGLGAALFVGTAAMLWRLDGRPHGFEARIAEKLGALRARLLPRS